MIHDRAGLSSRVRALGRSNTEAAFRAGVGVGVRGRYRAGTHPARLGLGGSLERGEFGHHAMAIAHR